MSKIVLALLFLFSYSSCTDQGCIEADDFGEYEQQILTIEANGSAKNCQYDPSKGLTAVGQGSGLNCLFSGNITIVDEKNDSYSATQGCSGLSASLPAVVNLCVNQCIQQCLASSSSNSTGAEPNWTSTAAKKSDQNIGVTISPGSEIYIRAIGNVILGGDIKMPDIKVDSTIYGLQSKKYLAAGPTAASLNDLVLDVKANKSQYAEFSGRWIDNANSGNPAGSIMGAGTTAGVSSTNSTYQEQAYNGARMLVAYLVPSPAGYGFNGSGTQQTEQAGTIGVPLRADPDLWRCNYTALGSVSLTETNCFSSSYKDTGDPNTNYPGANDSAISQLFYISSSVKADNLGDIGGMIRWEGDGIGLGSPFNGIYCNPNCYDSGSHPLVVDPSRGGLVGDLSNAAVIIVNNNEYAVRMRFQNLANNDSDTSGRANICNIALVGKITGKNAGANNVTIGPNSRSIAVNNAAWSNSYIDLEAGDKFIINTNSASYGTSSPATNCGRVIAYKFDKFQDIEIRKSGYISLATLYGPGGFGICDKISATVINPNGNRNDFGTAPSTFDADFYENGATTPQIFNVGSAITGASNAWSTTKIFVRQGQKLRFNPESWGATLDNGAPYTFTSATLKGNRQCGIGMAMKIEERPALLCRGSDQESVPNPLCKQKLDSAGNITCDAYAPECFSSTSSSFCPNAKCQLALDSSAWVDADCLVPNSVTKASCASCNTLKTNNANPATNPPTLSPNLIQCYDLEHYQGRVSNIKHMGSSNSFVNGFSREQLADPGFAKGAVKLAPFNGTYGNFESLIDNGKIDTATGNHIYQLKQPMIFAVDGRLKFLILDGIDFNQARYNGNSGYYKISLSGRQEFSNGEMLEAKLCLETANSDGTVTNNCSSSTPPAIVTEPQIVEIDHSTLGTPDITYTSGYRFDSYGSILRVGADSVTGSAICTQAAAAGSSATCFPANLIGSNYYQHSYQYLSAVQVKALDENAENTRLNAISKLRITFKIADSDIVDCNMTTGLPATPNGVIMTNAFYVPDASTVTTPVNNGKTCSSADIAATDGCKKQYVCANKYANNSGSYQVIVKVKNKGKNLSSIVNSVISPIIEIIDGPVPDCNIATATTSGVAASINPSLVFDGVLSKDKTTCGVKQPGEAERIYKLVISNFTYKAILNICLVIMVSFYGVGYLMGVSEFSQGEIISRVIKIGIIYLFVSPEGWYWFDRFFVGFFKHGTDYMAFLMSSSFDNSPALNQAIANQDFHDKSILFSSVDNVFSLFFSTAVHNKISALLFTGIFGWAYLLIIYLSFMLYVYAVASAILLYLTSQVFISLLFILGPIFFIFLLFSQTKDMFDKWLSQLIGFSLQQIFLLTTLTFFNMMMYEVLKLSLGYRVCWDDVWVINIVTRIKLLSFWTIPSIPPRLDSQTGPGLASAASSIPSIFSILFIWVIASLMKEFITFMTDLAADIGGGIRASELSSGVKDAVAGMQKTFDKHGGKAIKAKIGSQFQKVDRALFDSGKLAKEGRKAREAQNTKDTAARKSMASAGEKAVADYKEKNADKFKTMTKDEQSGNVERVKREAMINQAKKLGRGDDAEKLMKDKGLKYEGSNIFGAVSQGLKQGAVKGGALSTSIGERKASTAFSRENISKAMKNLDETGRGELLAGVVSGKIELKSERGRGRKEMAASFGKGVKTVATLGIPKAIEAYKERNKNVNKAREQLIEEGVIPRMRPGTEFSRTDPEKAKIKKRAGEISSREAINTKTNDSKAIQNVRLQSQIAKSLEEGQGGQFTRKSGTFAARMLGKEKGITSYGKKTDFEDSMTLEQAQEVGDAYLSRIAEENDEAQGVRNDLNANYQASVAKVADLEGKPEIQEMRVQEALLASAQSTKEEKSQATREISRIKASPTYSKTNKKLQEARAAAIQHRSSKTEAVVRRDASGRLVEKFQNAHAISARPGDHASQEDKDNMARDYKKLVSGVMNDRGDSSNLNAINEFNDKYNSFGEEKKDHREGPGGGDEEEEDNDGFDYDMELDEAPEPKGGGYALYGPAGPEDYDMDDYVPPVPRSKRGDKDNDHKDD